MMVKKRSMSETVTEAESVVISAVETQEAPANTAAEQEEDSGYEEVLAVAQEIRKNNKVLGYILKSKSKATVDLNEPAKIVEHAMLSSQAFESSQAIAESLDLGEVGTAVVEGKDAKVLCLNLGENKVSLFLKKEADTETFKNPFLQTE
jgi:predicted regulator of Ras-like GTPase activity (Roadblock/LC7/MglB family)